MKKKILTVVLALAVLFSMTAILSGCGNEEKSTENKGKIILATTTSTKDSGLLDEILPVFEKNQAIL